MITELTFTALIAFGAFSVWLLYKSLTDQIKAMSKQLEARDALNLELTLKNGALKEQNESLEHQVRKLSADPRAIDRRMKEHLENASAELAGYKTLREKRKLEEAVDDAMLDVITDELSKARMSGMTKRSKTPQ